MYTPSPQRIVTRWMALRIASRDMVALSYKEYVQRAQRQKRRPMPKDKWESRYLGKGKGNGEEKKKRLLKAFPKASKKMVEALSKAPQKTLLFFANKEFRNETTKAAARKLKGGGKKAAKALWENAKKEITSFPKAGKILVNIAKEKRAPTKEERKTLYGVGVYVAGTVLGSLAGGAGGALFGGSKALLHSLSLHIGIGAASSNVDDMFLHTETVESAATVGGVTKYVGLGTGDIPGFGQIMDAAIGATRTFLGSDSRPISFRTVEGDGMEKFIAGVYDKIVEHLDNGISDEDIKSVLENG